MHVKILIFSSINKSKTTPPKILSIYVLSFIGPLINDMETFDQFCAYLGCDPEDVCYSEKTQKVRGTDHPGDISKDRESYFLSLSLEFYDKENKITFILFFGFFKNKLKCHPPCRFLENVEPNAEIIVETSGEWKEKFATSKKMIEPIVRKILIVHDYDLPPDAYNGYKEWVEKAPFVLK